MVMIMVNIHEAKAKLSEYLDAVGRGERVMICNRNRPVAELRAVSPASANQRKLGTAVGKVVLPTAFFDPLPDDVVEAFEGENRDAKRGDRVAETKASHRKGSRRRR
jgi:prevent-host-death family protein